MEYAWPQICSEVPHNNMVAKPGMGTKAVGSSEYRVIPYSRGYSESEGGEEGTVLEVSQVTGNTYGGSENDPNQATSIDNTTHEHTVVW